jgi:hypothetical protein
MIIKLKLAMGGFLVKRLEGQGVAYCQYGNRLRLYLLNFINVFFVSSSTRHES